MDSNSEIVRVLRRAGEVAATIPDDPVSTRFGVLAEIAELQAVAGDEEGSKRIAEEAAKAGGHPTFLNETRIRVRKNILRMLSRAQIRAGNRVAATASLRELARLDELVPELDRVTSLRELAGSQAGAGDLAGAGESARRALKAAEALPLEYKQGGVPAGVQERPLGLLRAAEALESAGMKEPAGDVRRRAWGEAMKTEDRAARLEALGSLICDRAEAGDVSGALTWLDACGDLPEKGPFPSKPYLLRVIAVADAKSDTSEALRTAGRIADPRERLAALSGVAQQLAILGRWTNAAVAWQVVSKDEMTRSEGFYPAALAYAQARAGDRAAAAANARRALDAAERVLREGSPRNLSSVVPIEAVAATALWLAGDRDAARKALQRARELIDATTKGQFAANTFAKERIAWALAEMGDFDGFMQMFSGSPQLDVEIRSAVERGMSARVGEGDVPGALRLLEALTRGLDNVRVEAELAAKVAADVARIGDSKHALRWAEAQSSATTKARALLGVGRGLMEKTTDHP